MLRHSVNSLVFAVVATISAACDIHVTVVAPEEKNVSSSGPAETTETPETTEPERPDDSEASSSGEPDSDTTDFSTGSTGAEESTSGSIPEESTGSPLAQVGDACAHDQDCESALCALGACAPVAPNPCDIAPDQCGATSACVTFPGGPTCVATGDDASENGTVAKNESPAGSIAAMDTDVWQVADLSAGTYSIKLKASSEGALTILSAEGEVLAAPADGLEPDDKASGFVDYVVTLDFPQPFIAIAVQGTTDNAEPYYFYTATVEP